MPRNSVRTPRAPSATILMRIDRDVPQDLRAAIAEAVGANLLEVVDLS